jgi:serpin B
MKPAHAISSGLRNGSVTLARAACLLAVSALLWGCATPAAAAGIGLATANATRAPGNEQDASAAATAVTAFGLDLYRVAGEKGGNLVISPASIAIALSMARAGANGLTASQMDQVMHATADGAKGMNSLDQALSALSGTFRDDSGKSVELRLHIANTPFAQKDMSLEAAYLETLATHYGAGLRLVDFKSDSQEACKLINGWVSDQTEKRIPKLLDSLDPMTRLVLVNAIYLKAPWETRFADSATKDAPFTTAGGSQVTVPTMNATIGARYASGSGWQAVEVPYVGGSLAMTIIVPDDLTAFERSLDAGTYAQIAGALSSTEVSLSLPRFKTETHVDLADMLVGMGMTDAFDPDKADFSGITTDEILYISNVIHQANISVDEKGTEAAAATAVVMRATGMPAEPVTVRVDRPFLFAVRDTRTGAVLFLGRIVDPSK